MEKQLSQKESLDIIQQMVTVTRQSAGYAAPTFLMWGWLVILAAMINLVLILIGFEKPYLSWPILMVAGGVASPFISRQKSNNVQVKSYSDRMMTYIFGGMVGPIALNVLVGVHFGWEVAFPLFMVLYGYTGLLAGGALRFKSLVVGGVVAIAIGLVSVFLPYFWQLLTVSLTMMASNIIPGYLLKKG
jgi:hypothetical protein